MKMNVVAGSLVLYLVRLGSTHSSYSYIDVDAPSPEYSDSWMIMSKRPVSLHFVKFTSLAFHCFLDSGKIYLYINVDDIVAQASEIYCDIR